MMSNLRQAAQQALEALENAGEAVYAHGGIAAVGSLNTAATDLRAALAEPDYWQEEARRYAGNADYWRKRYKALAEPEQEPFSDDAERYARKLHDEREYYKALFTAPTPRKPLTDEEIERVCVPLGAAMLSFTEVARAIERAHGIGGQHDKR